MTELFILASGLPQGPAARQGARRQRRAGSSVKAIDDETRRPAWACASIYDVEQQQHDMCQGERASGRSGKEKGGARMELVGKE